MKKAQQDIVYNESQMEEQTKQLSEYDSLEEIEELVIRLEKIETEVEWTEDKITKLIGTEINITNINKSVEDLEKSLLREF